MWWLNPWSYAISLKSAVELMHDLADKSASQIRNLSTAVRVKTEDADYHKKRINDFQGKVEKKLTAVKNCPSYEDTLDLVDWAASELNRLFEQVENTTASVNYWSGLCRGGQEKTKELIETNRELKDELAQVKAFHAASVSKISKLEAEVLRLKSNIEGTYTQAQVDDLCDQAALDAEMLAISRLSKKKTRKPSMARSARKKGGRK